MGPDRRETRLPLAAAGCSCRRHARLNRCCCSTPTASSWRLRTTDGRLGAARCSAAWAGPWARSAHAASAAAAAEMAAGRAACLTRDTLRPSRRWPASWAMAARRRLSRAAPARLRRGGAEPPQPARVEPASVPGTGSAGADARALHGALPHRHRNAPFPATLRACDSWPRLTRTRAYCPGSPWPQPRVLDRARPGIRLQPRQPAAYHASPPRSRLTAWPRAPTRTRAPLFERRLLGTPPAADAFRGATCSVMSRRSRGRTLLLW